MSIQNVPIERAIRKENIIIIKLHLNHLGYSQSPLQNREAKKKWHSTAPTHPGVNCLASVYPFLGRSLKNLEYAIVIKENNIIVIICIIHPLKSKRSSPDHRRYQSRRMSFAIIFYCSIARHLPCNKWCVKSQYIIYDYYACIYCWCFVVVVVVKIMFIERKITKIHIWQQCIVSINK